LYINMVKVGEASGSLNTTLNSLTEFIEKSEQTKAKVKSAMVYPIVVLVIAIGILAFLMIAIIPRFTEIFEGLLEGAQIPALTRFVVAASNLVMHRSPLVVAVIVAIVVAINVISRFPKGAYFLDYLKLKMPVFGKLQTMVSVSRFSRTLSTLMTSGVQILQALNMVKNTVGNTVVASEIQHVHDSVKEGESFSGPLENSKVFPQMVVSMIAVGDETGRVPEMLGKIADNYDVEVDAAVDGLTSIIEPVLIIFLAVVVGTIVIAMFMPLIQIMGNLR
ncbi:MAG: type II secretion system F family protein, partial [Lentisphaerae bacterium]|nr:type II secretion system F family protein [Lentisphaerota bacterium]